MVRGTVEKMLCVKIFTGKISMVPIDKCRNQKGIIFIKGLCISNCNNCKNAFKSA